MVGGDWLYNFTCRSGFILLWLLSGFNALVLIDEYRFLTRGLLHLWFLDCHFNLLLLLDWLQLAMHLHQCIDCKLLDNCDRCLNLNLLSLRLDPRQLLIGLLSVHKLSRVETLIVLSGEGVI